MKSWKLAIAGAAAAAFSVSTAGAAVLFSENFDDEAATFGSELNFTGFDQFTVEDGSVDLISSGGFGISCFGGTGGCVDLDGSTSANPTSLILSTAINFEPGVIYTLSFDLSGNQRVAGQMDSARVEIAGIGSAVLGPFSGDTPFQHFSFDFDVDSMVLAGISFFVDGQSDNVGLILDNVLLTAEPMSDVPLPAAAPLMLAGLAGFGGLMRKRRKA
ncbi:MAG: VPLPA-CTERM sorting domain-containing protein [Parvularculaceae bacterium]